MIQKNIDYLKEGLKSLGFGDKLNLELEKNVSQGLPAFNLKHNMQVGSSKIENTLHFRKSSVSNMYFLNRYDATLKHNYDEAKDVTQTFYIIRNTGITAKEAFNLLEGRAIHKQLMNHEGEKHTAWQQLDFNQKDERGNYMVKQFPENYPFNLEKALHELPIKEMNGSVHENLLVYSLKKGNIHEVTMDKGQKMEKMFIEANPQFKMINVYDSNFRKVEKHSLVQDGPVAQSVNKEVKSEPKVEAGRELTKQEMKKDGDGDERRFEKRQRLTKRKGLSH